MKSTLSLGALFLLLAAVLFVQCTGEKKNPDTLEPAEAEKAEAEQDVTQTEAGKPQFTVDEIFQKQVTEVFDAYVELKEAFVSSDAGKVKKEGGFLSEQAGNVAIGAFGGGNYAGGNAISDSSPASPTAKKNGLSRSSLRL